MGFWETIGQLGIGILGLMLAFGAINLFLDDTPAPPSSASDGPQTQRLVAPTFEPSPSGSTSGESFDPQPQEQSYVARTFDWSYGGWEWTWDLEIPRSLYDYYGERDFIYTEDGEFHEYSVHVQSTADDEYIEAIAQALESASDDAGFGEYDRVAMAVAFVQQLDYTRDEATTDFDEFPRYPVETLMEKGGDCEDTSILLASILQAMGYGSVLFGIFEHEAPHMAVGLLSTEDSGYGGTTYQGEFYAFVETTNGGWDIGEVPDAYVGYSPIVFDLEPRPAIRITDWVIDNYEDDSRFAEAHMDVVNYGGSTGYEYELQVWMASNNRYTDSFSCTIQAIQPEEGYYCQGYLKWPNDANPVVDFFVVNSYNEYVDRDTYQY